MISYGSSDRPAILDPWQTLVEVGWPPPWIAFALIINRRKVDDDDQPYSINEIACFPEDAIPGGFAALNTLQSFQYEYSSGDAVSFSRARRGDVWDPVAIDSHEGLPDLPIVHEFGFPEWFVELRSPSNQPLRSRPQARWDALSGAAHGAGLPVPFNPDLEFVIPNQNLALRMYGTQPAHGDICRLGTRKALAPLPDPLPWDTPFASLEVNLDLVRIHAIDRDWQAVAVAHEPHEDEGTLIIPPNAGVMWVLCEPTEGT